VSVPRRQKPEPAALLQNAHGVLLLHQLQDPRQKPGCDRLCDAQRKLRQTQRTAEKRRNFGRKQTTKTSTNDKRNQDHNARRFDSKTRNPEQNFHLLQQWLYRSSRQQSRYLSAKQKLKREQAPTPVLK